MILFHIDTNNLDNFIELITDLAFFKNLKGEYTHCNEAFLSFIKKSREEVINKTVFDFYSYENAFQFAKGDAEILAKNKIGSFEEVFKREDDDDIYFHTTKNIIYDSQGMQQGLFCVVRNITAQKQYELIYEDNQRILEYIAVHDSLKNVLDTIVHLAQQRNHNSMCSILLLDESASRLLHGSAPNLPTFYNEAIDGVVIGEKVGSCGSVAFKQERVVVENIDTHENWQPYLELTNKANLHACWSEPVFSSKDQLLGTFAIYHDKPKNPSDFELKLISSYAHLASVAIEKNYNEKIFKEKEQQILEQTKLANEMLKKLASKDYLTGLHNRLKLDEALDYQLKHANRYGNIFGIIMIDIDFFKQVNDEHGHQAGDTILCEFADLLTKNSRETDIVGRWGGEEFLVIAENVNKDSLSVLAEKLRASIEKNAFPIIKKMTASFGTTMYQSDDKMHKLVARADEALYQAKKSGRNCVKFL